MPIHKELTATVLKRGDKFRSSPRDCVSENNNSLPAACPALAAWRLRKLRWVKRLGSYKHLLLSGYYRAAIDSESSITWDTFSRSLVHQSGPVEADACFAAA